MNLMENIRLALSSLRSNIMRALLTMLGIIIGVGAVIGIVTMGDSLTGYMTSSMMDMGANNITLFLQKRESVSGGARAAMAGGFEAQMASSSGANAASLAAIEQKNLITADMLADVREKYGDKIDYISVTDAVGSGNTTNGRLYANLSLTGVSMEYEKANNITLQEGRFLSQRDQDEYKKVAVVSDKLVNNMFGNENALGEQLRVNVGTHTGIYTIVGVYKYENNGGMPNTASDKDIQTQAFIPISTANKITRHSGSQVVTLVAKIGVDSINFASEVESHVNTFYYVRNIDYKVGAFSMESLLETMQEMLGTIQIAVSAIAAISLLVGGIGVMNIMLVSITERTREIGTRKALGATNGEIRTQFIVEAMIICLIGGIIGIGVGVLIGMVGASLLGFPGQASLSAIMMATGFSLAIGLFFGYYPANKAARLDPIEALRYE